MTCLLLLLLHREQLVTPDELNQSKKVLHSMLLEYVNNEENAVEGNRDTIQKMLKRITGLGAEAPSARDLRSIKGLEDEIMNKVVKNYETESYSPMKGLLFGNLMTVMLIQMQKMKMHMEAALLTMDQVLTSNELTMAATAAIPGIAISGLVGYSFYWLCFKSKAPVNRSSEQLELRLALGNIERAINSLILQMTDSGVQSSVAKVCLQGPVYLDSSVEDQAGSRSRSNSTVMESPDRRDGGEDYSGGGSGGGGINSLAPEELLVLRYSGLVIFQVLALVLYYQVCNHDVHLLSLSFSFSFSQFSSFFQSQTAKFTQTLKLLFLSPRHCVVAAKVSWLERFFALFGLHLSSPKWMDWFPFIIFNYFSNTHPKNCKKCAFSHSGIGASISTEFDGIKRDMLDLANPLMSPLKKLELTARMRSAYDCLSV